MKKTFRAAVITSSKLTGLSGAIDAARIVWSRINRGRICIGSRLRRNLIFDYEEQHCLRQMVESYLTQASGQPASIDEA